MPRIVNVLPSLQGGGAERVAVNLANDWKSRGFEVDFALMAKQGEFLSSVSAGIGMHDLGAARVRDVPWRLYLCFRKKKPDITLVHMWPLTSVAVLAWLLAGRPGKLFLCEHVGLTDHVQRDLSTPLGFVKFVLRLSHRLASGVVAVSKGAAVDLAQLTGVPIENIQIIHNPVVSQQLEPRPSRAESQQRYQLWGGTFKYYLITVGTLKKQKNHQLFLESFAHVCDELDAGLVILGEGSERASLEALIMKFGLNERVRLAGFHPDPTPWLRAADLFVLSSDFEGFANVVAESLACGTPVVSTACPHGPDEILQNGKHGVLVPVGDRVALANGIREALGRSWDPAALQQRALDFSIPKKSAEYLKLFGLDTFFDPVAQKQASHSKGQVDG
jgi:glycosyltransferase involved in cell wall biosynthesis